MADEEEAKKPAGAPMWMVTFSDLMTLLLTFFVLLLSMSNVSEPKFKRAVTSLYEAFEGGRIVGEPVAAIVPISINPTNQPSRNDQTKEVSETEQVVTKMHTEIVTELEESKAKGLLEVEQKENKLLLRFPGDITFASGSDELNPIARDMFVKIGKLLQGRPLKFEVAGYTDDLPIKNSRFRSNWDLSSARAVSVTHVLLESGNFVNEQMQVIGHGPGFPLVPNDSRENRAYNRRVEISINPDETQFDLTEFGEVVNFDSLQQAHSKIVELSQKTLNFDSLRSIANLIKARTPDLIFDGKSLQQPEQNQELTPDNKPVIDDSNFDKLLDNSNKNVEITDNVNSRYPNNVNLESRPKVSPQSFDEIKSLLRAKVDSLKKSK